MRVEISPELQASAIYFTPSHPMERHRLKDETLVLTLAEEKMSPGPFRLSWMESAAKKGEAFYGPDISVYAAPDAENGRNGYFLAILGKGQPRGMKSKSAGSSPWCWTGPAACAGKNSPA